MDRVAARVAAYPRRRRAPHQGRATHVSNMLLVACNARTPMRLSFVEPRAGGSDAPAPGSYKFTVEFTTVGINSATGDIMPYTAPTEELRLEMAEAHALVAYAKKTLKQPWAAEPVGHRLRASGCGATSWCRFSRIRPYPHSLARVCAPNPHTRAARAGSPALVAPGASAHCPGCPADVVSRLWLVYLR